MAEQQLYSAFICHASGDRQHAQQVCDNLESRGFRCWIAPRDVRAGHEYSAEILHGIQSSRCLVLLLSTAANDSAFVKREVERAVSKRKPVFPVRIEDVKPSPALELFVSTAHWIDAFRGALGQHVDSLAKELSDESVVQTRVAESARIARRRQMPKWIVAAGAFLLLLGAIVVGNRLSAKYVPQREVILNDDPVQQELDKAGVKISSIRQEMFKPHVYFKRSRIPRLHFTGPPELNVLNNWSTSYAIGDGEFKATTFSNGLMLMEDRMFAELLKEGRAKFKVAPPSHQPTRVSGFGPYEYRFDFKKLLLEAYKQRALDEQEWMKFESRYRGARLAFPELRDFYPAVRRVLVGPTRDSLKPVIEIPEATNLADRDATWEEGRKLPSWIEDNPAVPEYFMQLEFFDGTRSEIRSKRRVTVTIDAKPRDQGATP